jgi:hypothetical protein
MLCLVPTTLSLYAKSSIHVTLCRIVHFLIFSNHPFLAKNSVFLLIPRSCIMVLCNYNAFYLTTLWLPTLHEPHLPAIHTTATSTFSSKGTMISYTTIFALDWTLIHHFSAPKPGVSCCAAPHINAESSPLDYFQLAFTNEPLILTESKHYYQQHIHGQVGKLDNQTISFSSSDKPAGTQRSGHHKRLLVNQHATMYSTLHKSHDMWSVCACNKVLHFENNHNPSYRAYPDYDSLWKSRRIFSYLNNIHSTLNHPTENLALDELPN